MTQIDWSNRKRDTADPSFLHYQLKLLIIINNSIFDSIISVKMTNPPYLAYGCSNQFGSRWCWFSYIFSFSVLISIYFGLTIEFGIPVPKSFFEKIEFSLRK